MKKSIVVFLIASFMITIAGAYAAETGGERMKTDVLDKVAKEAMLKKGVKEITYEQFMEIRKSGEKYVLLDALPEDSYAKGHIEGALSLPVDTINASMASARLGKDARIIVYCGSFQCGASTQAAKALMALGYNVLDYKGGLKEWQEKGNKLVR